jgi:hypothetical protein
VREKKERPQYPWQIPIASRFPASELSETERRRQDAQFFYLFELLLLEEGLGSELVYYEERDVFRFSDGRFALSRESTQTGLASKPQATLRLGGFRERPFLALV